MFWRKGASKLLTAAETFLAQLALADPTTVNKVPVPLPLIGKLKDGTTEEEVATWIDAARSVGLQSQVANEELDQFLRFEGIESYPSPSVFKYLDDRAQNEKTEVIVWALRPEDRLPDGENVWAMGPWCAVTSRFHVGDLGRGWYRDIVPLPVLLTAQRLIDRFGARAKFYVLGLKSDDPFLAVMVDNGSLRFVERWDKPSYRR